MHALSLRVCLCLSALGTHLFTPDLAVCTAIRVQPDPARLGGGVSVAELVVAMDQLASAYVELAELDVTAYRDDTTPLQVRGPMRVHPLGQRVHPVGQCRGLSCLTREVYPAGV